MDKEGYEKAFFNVYNLEQMTLTIAWFEKQ